MDYAIRILLEKKLDIEVEMEKGDSDKRNSLKKKYVDVCVALNKLNLTRVSEKPEIQICYKDNKVCKYACEGLCKESY